MINFPCENCKAQLTFEDKLGGSNALCPQCKEMIYIPKMLDAQKGIKVSKSSFSPMLQKFVKTKASDIDDDVTDNKFLVAKEVKSKQSEAVRNFQKIRLEDIDDDLTDNKYLDPGQVKSSKLSPSLKKFIQETKDTKKKKD